MNKIATAMVAMLIIGLSTPAFSDWKIQFGSDSSQAGLTPPAGAEDFPVGPSSYRMVEDNLWVLDAAKGRVLCFNAENKLINDIKIPGLPAKFILDDFALQMADGKPVSIIVTESMDRQIVKFSLTGEEQLKIKTNELLQLDEIGIDTNGQFYVGDFAKEKIAVFSADGKMLRTIPWQGSGFAIDQENNLHTITFTDNIGHTHIKLSPDGKELAKQELGMPEVQNPRIWDINAKGEMLLSVVPPAGSAIDHSLLTFSVSGEILNKAVFKNPYYIKRYLMAGKDTVWLVSADYSSAESSIAIIPVK